MYTYIGNICFGLVTTFIINRVFNLRFTAYPNRNPTQVAARTLRSGAVTFFALQPVQDTAAVAGRNLRAVHGHGRYAVSVRWPRFMGGADVYKYSMRGYFR